MWHNPAIAKDPPAAVAVAFHCDAGGAGKTTPLQANLHLWSQKRRRSSFIPSRCLPACLAPIQRISLPQVKASMALKVALDTPYQSCNAPTSILQLDDMHRRVGVSV
jgi:hypothetical protein